MDSLEEQGSFQMNWMRKCLGLNRYEIASEALNLPKLESSVTNLSGGETQSCLCNR